MISLFNDYATYFLFLKMFEGLLDRPGHVKGDLLLNCLNRNIL